MTSAIAMMGVSSSMRTENKLLYSAFRLGCMAIASAMFLGCSDRLRTHPASGKVEFTSGGVVHVGTVELKSRVHGVHARGSIGADGSFVLSTYDEGDGAVEGAHDCVVVQFVMTEDIAGHKPSTIGVIDRRYASYATSGLQVDISPDKNNEVLIKVDGYRKEQPAEHSHK